MRAHSFSGFCLSKWPTFTRLRTLTDFYERASITVEFEGNLNDSNEFPVLLMCNLFSICASFCISSVVNESINESVD